MHIMSKTNYEIRYHRKYIIIMPKHWVTRLTDIFMTSGLQSRYYVDIAYFNKNWLFKCPIRLLLIKLWLHQVCSNLHLFSYDP